MTISSADFAFLRKLVESRCGIVVDEGKQYLIESRLMPVSQKAGLKSLNRLIERLVADTDSPLADKVIDAMTTNETLFFRDRRPFEHLSEILLPALYKARKSRRSLRIWCAAASSGQEPYSLAMAIRETAQDWSDWNIEILGTDISPSVLEKARNGIYSQFEVQRGVPVKLLLKYFKQQGTLWQISPEIRNMVQWRPLNLLENFSLIGKFDIIMCRNVLIYFSSKTKRDVLKRLSMQLHADGYLFLGASETLVGFADDFIPMPDHHGVYIPNPAPGKAPRATPGKAPNFVKYSPTRPRCG